MKKTSAYNPSREEVEKAVMKYLEDGGDIQKIQFNTNMSITSDIAKGWKGIGSKKKQPWDNFKKPGD